jgi:DNA-binding FrmR family transcriptional regulator
MGLGYVLVLEREIPGLDPRELDGRQLAAVRHALDAIAHEYDLPGLGEFVAFSHGEAEALAEDMKFDAPTVGSQSGRFFAPSRAIEVVRAIRSHLGDEPDDVAECEAVLAQLEVLESMLNRAEEAGVRFRLSVDY